MSAHERQMRIVDIGFQVGTGRSNTETEQKAWEVLGLDGLCGFAMACREASDRKLMKVWSIVCGNGRSVMGF